MRSVTGAIARSAATIANDVAVSVTSCTTRGSKPTRRQDILNASP
jgi:hypothetical protein